jgi:hypothetical protein
MTFGKTVVASELTGSPMAGTGKPYQKCRSKNSRVFNLGEHAFQHALISGPPSTNPHGFQGLQGYPCIIKRYPGISMAWISMDIHAKYTYPWKSMDIHGHPWTGVCMKTSI